MVLGNHSFGGEETTKIGCEGAFKNEKKRDPSFAPMEPGFLTDRYMGFQPSSESINMLLVSCSLRPLGL